MHDAITAAVLDARAYLLSRGLAPANLDALDAQEARILDAMPHARGGFDAPLLHADRAHAADVCGRWGEDYSRAEAEALPDADLASTYNDALWAAFHDLT